MATSTATPGMNWIYQAPQIHIPPQLPNILKTYIKAAIRTQPHDLLVWSAYYFKCVHRGQVPPVKKHLEFPLFAGPGNITPGYLAVLVNQLGREGVVPLHILYEKWLGLTLNKDDLDRMLLLRYYSDKMINIAEFIAIAAGHLCKTLPATMTLVCELLTLEPEGGCAKIPLRWFNSLYKMLAELDCGPARPDEIVVQNIILPFGAKDSKLWSIPEGVPPDIRDMIRRHFLKVQSDLLGDEEESVESDNFSYPSTSTIHPGEGMDRPKSAKPSQKKAKSQEQTSTEGLPMWDPTTCDQKPYTLEEGDEGSCSEMSVHDEQPSQPRESKPKERAREMKDVLKEHQEMNEAAATVKDEAEVKTWEERVQEDEDMKKEEEKLEPSKEVYDDSVLPSIMSLPPTKGYRAEDESSLYNLSSGLLGFDSEGSVPADVEPSSFSSRDSMANVKYFGDVLLRYHVPGIGPKVPSWQIEQVLDFMLQASRKQDGYVMPRNIRQPACPPLDRMDIEQVSHSSSVQQGSNLSESCSTETSIRGNAEVLNESRSL